MKKFGLLVAFVILSTAVVFSAGLTVEGRVAQVLSVLLGPSDATTQTVSFGLDNTGAAVAFENITSLKVISSQKNWVISFSSGYSGLLKESTQTLPGIPYQIKVDTSSVTAIGTDNLLANYVQLSTSKTITANGNEGKSTTAGFVFPISINIPEYEEFIETTNTGATTYTVYSDVITISIAAN